MYDIIVIGAGITGVCFANKIVKFAKILLLDSQILKERPKSTNIFPFHNKPFLDDSEWDNPDIFPIPHLRTNYMGSDINGFINSKEFGRPLGKVCYTEKLLNRLAQKFEEQGGELQDNQKVMKVNKYSDHVEVITDKGQSFSCKLLIFATGSRALELQKSVGFEIPDEFVGLYTHLYGNEDKLNEILDVNYIYHINTKISKSGPFFINRGLDRISLGFLGDFQPIPELTSKLRAVIDNYQRIQPFINGLQLEFKPIISKISKHPIKNFSQDRMLVLGEAAGLVTAFFYEGIMCGMISAELASQTIKNLIESEREFTRENLHQYDKEVVRVLKNYFKNGSGSEYIFYNSGSNMSLIWNTYCKIITRDKTLRSYIYDAYQHNSIEEIANYDNSRDRYVGERLLANLPLLKKITLSPLFLKAMFK